VDGFKKFLLRGNVVDLAVAVVIGAAFGAIVTAFVAAFITPLVGLATGATGDFSGAQFCVGDTGDCADGVLFPYGQFVQAVLSFLIIATVVYFFVVRPVNRLMERFKTEPEVEAETKQCPECLSNIPVPASRCAFCTVEQLDVPR
jgi:large conductance mechanosensitive channel